MKLLPDAVVQRVLFAITAAALIAANVLVVRSGMVQARLWEDEAFNLTVPLNLIAGLGYTSDGTLSGSVLTPFDARISTGPVVLLPVAAVIGLGADPVIGGRAVVLVFWMLLIAGLFVVGRATAGPWGGLVAAAVPLAVDANQLPSPVQGPVDILGEIPAAALIVWAAVAARRRPWLGGLLLGLAVQTKFIALLAAPALVVFVFFAVAGQPFGKRVLRVVPAAVAAMVPTIAYELWKLIALGPAGYVDATRSFGGFLLSGGQRGVRPDPGGKVVAVADAWFVPAWVAVVAGLLVLGGVAALLIGAARAPRRLGLLVERDRLWARREVVLVGVMGLTGLAVYLGWWLASAHTPVWIRHPSPALFAFAPMVVVAAIIGWRVLAADGRMLQRATAAVAVGGVAASLAASVVVHAAIGTPSPVTLDAQRDVAARIAAVPEVAESGWIAVQWGARVSLAVLAGKHVALVDATDAIAECPWMWWESAGAVCDEVAVIGSYTICAAPGR